LILNEKKEKIAELEEQEKLTERELEDMKYELGITNERELQEIVDDKTGAGANKRRQKNHRKNVEKEYEKEREFTIQLEELEAKLNLISEEQRIHRDRFQVELIFY